MNNVEAIGKLNAREIELGIAGTSASWHAKYASSGVVYVGGLQAVLTEGDVLSIFEQYGIVVHVNLLRDEKTGTPRGFCFLEYSDPRSAVLAVDNLNGTQVLERTLRVDHVENYSYPEADGAAVNARPPGLAETAKAAGESERSRVRPCKKAAAEPDGNREALVMERLRAMRKQRAVESDLEKRANPGSAHDNRRQEGSTRQYHHSELGREPPVPSEQKPDAVPDPGLKNRKTKEEQERLLQKQKRREERAVIREARKARRERR